VAYFKVVPLPLTEEVKMGRTCDAYGGNLGDKHIWEDNIKMKLKEKRL
jgi:hypothetical protein